MEPLPLFKKFELTQIPSIENIHVDTLSNLTNSKDSDLLKVVSIKLFSRPSIYKWEEVMWIEGVPLWIQPIIAFLEDQTLPEDKEVAHKLRRRVSHYEIQDGVLYKRNFSLPLLRCTGGENANYVLSEIHEGISGNHTGGFVLVHKMLRKWYYWPTLKKYAIHFVRKCDKC